MNRRTGIVAAALIIILVTGSTVFVSYLSMETNSNTTSSSSSSTHVSSSHSSSSQGTTGSTSTGTSTSSSLLCLFPGSFPAVVGDSGNKLSAATNPSQTGSWTTYHLDNSRTGYEAASNFTSVTRAWTSTSLSGSIYAEPLVYGGSVLVATETNTVYSLDAQTGNIQWCTNLGPPVAGNLLQCGDINPSGITGTPVIDTSTNTIFVVTFSHLHHYLFSLSLNTGAILSNRSADPPGFIDTAQQQRAALSLANGMVYIPFGGLAGDCSQYHGWVVGLSANGTGTMDFYQVPTQREGGIWATSGATVGPAGTLYVATGNGASTTVFDHGSSVIALSPSLAEEGYFAPTNWVQLNGGDLDLGSTGPAFVGPSTLFQIGKAGVGYLLNATRLGGIGGEVYNASVCGGSYGGTAYAPPLLYVPCANGLFAIRIATSGSFSAAWHTSSFDSGPPIVTGGVVWSVNINSATLMGYSAATGHQLYSFPLGSVMHFVSPAAGGGMVFVGANRQVYAFQLGSG